MVTTTQRACRFVLAAAAMALLTAAPARADRPIADLARDTPISAYDGVVAWSAYDASTGRYRLVTRRGTHTVGASIAGATRPFDVSLGPDSSGRTVALYTRCRTANHGCDVYRYDLRTHQERKLVSVSSPSLDEAWPAQWRGRITFARRARTHVIDGFDHRPDPRGRGPVLACDIPYVKTLGSAAPSRRLDRSQCGYTEGMAIRGETIVHVTGVNQGGAGSESQVRLLRTRGGAARMLARAGGGEGGYSPFTEPSLSAGAVWLTRTGQRQGVQQGFLRIDLRSHKLTTIPANLNLAGSVARDEHGTFWYVQGPEPGFDYHGERPYCSSPIEPCRLVRATADPFSATPRALLPRLAIDGAQSQIINVPAAAPAQLAGTLTRTVVTGGRVSGVEPVAGAPIQLLRANELEAANRVRRHRPVHHDRHGGALVGHAEHAPAGRGARGLRTAAEDRQHRGGAARIRDDRTRRERQVAHGHRGAVAAGSQRRRPTPDRRRAGPAAGRSAGVRGSRDRR